MHRRPRRYEFCDIDTMEILCTKTIKTSELGADGYVVTFEEGTDGLKIDNAAANASRVPSLVFRNNIIRNITANLFVNHSNNFVTCTFLTTRCEFTAIF